MRKQRICPQSPVNSTYSYNKVSKAPRLIPVLVKRSGKLNQNIKCESATMFTSSVI